MKQQCENCIFFLRDGDRDLGLCRRFPCIWTNDKRGFEFPVMKLGGWCGEYKQKLND